MSDDRKRPFARFFYDDFLREYPHVYADDAAFATWMRLLVVAEKAWPLTPELPRSARSKPVQTLVDAGLVAIGPDYTYALRGHDAERTRRNAAGNAGAHARWNANAHAIASPNAMLVREREEKETTPPPQVGRRANGTNPRATGTNPRAAGTSPRQEREAQKRGPSALHEILSSIQKGPA